MFGFLARLAPLALCATTASAACTGAGLYDTMSETERAEIEAAAAAMPYGEGLFWEATRGDSRLILIGTLHVYDPRHETLVPGIERALDGADRLLVEMTFETEAEFEAAIFSDTSLILLPEGQTLPDLLPEELWADLSAAGQARGLPPMMLSRMQPWYLSLMLGIPPCAFQEVLAGERGLDHMIMDRAAAAGIPQQSLEPWDTLFRLFTQDPLEEQIKMLSISILDPAEQSAQYITMLDDYFAGRTAAIWELTQRLALDMEPVNGVDPEELFRRFEQGLLIDRNAAWIPVIEAAAQDDDHIVIAFGAAHLMGQDGVLVLLEQNGWTIAPFE